MNILDQADKAIVAFPKMMRAYFDYARNIIDVPDQWAEKHKNSPSRQWLAEAATCLMVMAFVFGTVIAAISFVSAVVMLLIALLFHLTQVVGIVLASFAIIWLIKHI